MASVRNNSTKNWNSSETEHLSMRSNHALDLLHHPKIICTSYYSIDQLIMLLLATTTLLFVTSY